MLFYINNLWFESRDTGPMKDNYYLEAKLVSRETSTVWSIEADEADCYSLLSGKFTKISQNKERQKLSNKSTLPRGKD